jgi:hypothetical protein
MGLDFTRSEKKMWLIKIKNPFKSALSRSESVSSACHLNTIPQTQKQQILQVDEIRILNFYKAVTQDIQ